MQTRKSLQRERVLLHKICPAIYNFLQFQISPQYKISNTAIIPLINNSLIAQYPELLINRIIKIRNKLCH